MPKAKFPKEAGEHGLGGTTGRDEGAEKEKEKILELGRTLGKEIGKIGSEDKSGI